jgi:glutamine amidotransferase
MDKIVIIDYGVGNHQSVANALKFLGYEFELSGDSDVIRRAGVYVLPGVGAMSEAMKNLKERNLIGILNEEVLNKKKPILGICLGMQMLAKYSEEDGRHECLGWIDGHVAKITGPSELRVPQVGWNTVHVQAKEPLFTRVEEGANFYFDHSYQFVCPPQYVAASCSYGLDIVAAVHKDNIFGVQFHPEKSQNNGLKLFRSFFNYVNSLSKAVA